MRMFVMEMCTWPWEMMPAKLERREPDGAPGAANAVIDRGRSDKGVKGMGGSLLAQTPGTGITNAGNEAGVGGGVFCDVDQDGLLDIIVNYQSSSRIYLQTGPLTFVEDPARAPMLIGSNPSQGSGSAHERTAICADFDRDGDNDFIVNTSLEVVVLENDGTGFFAVSANLRRPGTLVVTNPVPTPVPAMNSEFLGFIDYDNDGLLDFIVDNHNQGAFIMRNIDNSLFEPLLSPGVPGLATSGTSAGDYGAMLYANADECLEFCLRKNAGTNLYLNNGDGTFTPSSSATIQAPEAPNDFKAGSDACDLMNNGFFSVVWAGGLDTADTRTYLYFNTGVPSTDPAFQRISLGNVQGTATPIENVEFRSVICGDFNNDGALDIFLGSAGNSVEDQLLIRNSIGGSPTPTFTNTAITGSTSGKGAAIPADFDRDGDLDLVVNVRNGADPIVYVNTLAASTNYVSVKIRLIQAGLVRNLIGRRMHIEDTTGAQLSPHQILGQGRGQGTQSNPDTEFFGLTQPFPDPPNEPFYAMLHPACTGGGSIVRFAICIPDTPGAYQETEIIINADNSGNFVPRTVCAVDDTATTTAPSAVIIPVLANDYPTAHLDVNSVTFVSTATCGTFVVSSPGMVTFTPGAAPATCSIQYKVSDSTAFGGEGIATITVTVLMSPTVTPTTTMTHTATPTMTPSTTNTLSATPTATTTKTPTTSATLTATPSKTVTPTNTKTPSITPSTTTTRTATPTSSATLTATPSKTVTPTSTKTPSTTATRTATPTSSPTLTATPSKTVTPTNTKTSTPSLSGTSSSSLTPTRSPTPSETASTTSTSSLSSTTSPTPSVTSTQTPSSSASPTKTATNTASMTNTATSSSSSTATETPSTTMTHSATATPTDSPSSTNSGTATSTESPTPSHSPTGTASITPSASPTSSASESPSRSSSETTSPTSSNTASLSANASPSSTRSVTPSPSMTGTPSQSVSGTESSSPSPSGTASGTATNSASSSESITATRSTTKTRTSSRTPSPSASLSLPVLTLTASPTPTESHSSSRTPSKSAASTPNKTPSASASATHSPTASASSSKTTTPTASLSSSGTASVTQSPSLTPSSSASVTASNSASATATSSVSGTVSGSSSPSATSSPSASQSATSSPSPSRTPSRTPSPTPTVTTPVCSKPSDCDDGNDCTVDLCSSVGACEYALNLNGIPCDDGDFCTLSTTCDEGVCTDGTAVECFDGRPCTIDVCEPSVGCQFVPTTDCDPESNVAVLPVDEQEPPRPVILVDDYDDGGSLAGGLSYAIPAAQGAIEDDDGGGDTRFPGESDNEALTNVGFNTSIALIGVAMCSCAGFLALIFGMLATRELEKDESDIDRLEFALDAEQEVMAAPVESAAYTSLNEI